MTHGTETWQGSFDQSTWTSCTKEEAFRYPHQRCLVDYKLGSWITLTLAVAGRLLKGAAVRLLNRLERRA